MQNFTICAPRWPGKEKKIMTHQLRWPFAKYCIKTNWKIKKVQNLKVQKTLIATLQRNVFLWKDFPKEIKTDEK